MLKFSFLFLRYNSNIEIKSKQPVPLNADHTHFLMVDDGYRCVIKVTLINIIFTSAGTTILATEVSASSSPRRRR